MPISSVVTKATSAHLSSDARSAFINKSGCLSKFAEMKSHEKLLTAFSVLSYAAELYLLSFVAERRYVQSIAYGSFAPSLATRQAASLIVQLK